MTRISSAASHVLARISVAGGMAAFVLAIIAVVVPVGAEAQAAGVRRQDVSFRSGEVTLHGSVISPDTAGPHPAMALVAGSGPGPRDKYLLEAEAFARAGVVTLIYDKRTSGYSTTERSYAVLADDALAAVDALRRHRDVDRSAVGLWGHSEGGWVAPLAASESTDVAFVVTVGAAAVPAAQQTSWAHGNLMRDLGVSGSMVDRFLPARIRLLVSAGVFPEAGYDGVDVWERVQQPVLAIWGTQDRVVPPAESAQVMARALDRGGNRHYTIRFFPGEHAAHTTPDGFERDDVLAPGYPEAVTSWVHSVASGVPPPPTVERSPAQARRSTPVTPIAWYQSAATQFALFGLLMTAFLAYPVSALIRRLRRSEYPLRSAATRAARWLAVLGPLALLGVPTLVLLQLTGIVGPVVARRPLTWLALQALALATVVSAVCVMTGWRASRTTVRRAEQARLAALVLGTAMFVPWAIYWGVLLP